MADCHIKYLIVGGYAVMRYAEPRYTKDLDLWVKPDLENSKSVFDALRRFGAPLVNLTSADFAQEGHFYQMGVPPFRVDLLMSIPGLLFDDAWARRVAVDLQGVPALFVSKADLIIAKRAAGRPQDLIDAEALVVAPDA